MEYIEKIKSLFESDVSSKMSKLDLRNKYLGRKGLISEAFKEIKNIPADQKKQFGDKLNILKNNLEKILLATESSESNGDKSDLISPINLNSLNQSSGHLSAVTQTIIKTQEILAKIGFSTIIGPEKEDETHNFDLLNIPTNHPARDVWDTIWVTDKNSDKKLLRTHTSPVQIRYLEKHKPPIRIIAPGKVYRYEATDATHETCFHQIEGLVIDNKTSIATFKGVMEYLFANLFGREMQIRLRPSYFPFTEPSFEIDILFKDKWLEIAGAGMVHRQVLKNVGIEDKSYQGFAFGIGVERLVMLISGLDDIRYIHSGDLRFLYQLGKKS